ncbi:MAG TPA: hypothetical protein VFZ69_15765 [Longimicrobiales bacterium]
MTRFERLIVWGSTLAVSVTGLVYAWMKYLLEPVDAFAVVNHPLQPLVLKLHILTAPALVFGIGLIALRHIWPHFRTGVQRGRRSGLTAALVLVPMILSGYLIQAVTHIGWLRAIALSHLALGALFAIGAGVHYAVSRRARQSGGAARRAVPDRAVRQPVPPYRIRSSSARRR